MLPVDAMTATLEAREAPVRGSAVRADREVSITRLFDAPRELVFRLWTQPEHTTRWSCPKGMELLSCEMDARPGGMLRVRMRAPEGGMCVKRGVYREVVEPSRLVFTQADEDDAGRIGPETLVTVSFVDERGKTRLTLHQALFETTALRDAHRAGWTSTLEHLADYLAAA